MWGLHLNFLRLKITFLLMRAPRGHKAREGKKTPPRKVRSLTEMASGSLQPHDEGSATLTCPNLSSPGRAVINY